MTKVLFVDDEPNILAGLRRMLRTYRKEWDMSFSESGVEALKLLEEEEFDVIVSDMRMPGMDGAEFLSHVRDRYPGTIRVVLSGHSQQELTLRSIGPAHQYLSKPCDSEHLKSSIQSVMRLQSLISSETIKDLVESIDTLPSLPSIYIELVEILSSPEASIQQAAELIAKDMAMSAKVLQLVHSSFFGMPIKVTDVKQAVVLLGTEVLKPLILSTATFSQYEGVNLGGFPLEHVANHGLEIGMLARKIAEAEGASSDIVGQAFLAGVLHDIGKVVLAQYDPVGYREIWQQTDIDSVARTDLEEAKYGATHAEIGSYLIGLWGLPYEVIEAVTCHHQPDRCESSDFRPASAVYAAATISENASTVWNTHYLEKIKKQDRTDAWQKLALATERNS